MVHILEFWCWLKPGPWVKPILLAEPLGVPYMALGKRCPLAIVFRTMVTLSADSEQLGPSLFRMSSLILAALGQEERSPG